MRPRRHNPRNPPTPRKDKRPQDQDLKHTPKWETLHSFGPSYTRDGTPHDSLNHPLQASDAIPDTPIQALMEAAPFTEPARSRLEQQVVDETVVDAIETLSVEDQELVRVLVYVGMTFREAAVELGMDNHVQAFRRWTAVSHRLRTVLQPLAEEF